MLKAARFVWLRSLVVVCEAIPEAWRFALSCLLKEDLQQDEHLQCPVYRHRVSNVSRHVPTFSQAQVCYYWDPLMCV